VRSTLKGVSVAVALLCCASAVSLFIPPYPVSDFTDIKTSWRASDAWLLDRTGEPLSRVRIDHQRRRGEWIPAREVSPALEAMVIASEDRRFHEHGGVDWLALPAALKQTLTGGRRGGSTLTMQLAAYLHPQLEPSGRRGIVDKWRQMRQALAIERAWGKEQVLEAWLNLTPFRGELEGIDAASKALYAKAPQGLDRVESALLAALVRAPNAGASRVAQRACGLLKKNPAAPGFPLSPTRPLAASRLSPRSGARESFGADGAERDCLVAQGLAAGGLRAGRLERDLDGAAPHLARRLLNTAGISVRSTLDARLQRFAASTLQRHIRELEGRNVEDGALVVIDNESGEVLAWVGSSGELSGAREVDGVLALRLAGSTLKPFLYALAIERRLLTAASVLDDSPLAVTLPTGLYVPQNYDRSFKGQVSLRQALASSLNVPAVRTLALTGYEPFYRALKDLGFTLPRDADHYGYSLALGGAEVTLLQLTNAYRALANGGYVAAVRTIVVNAAITDKPTPTLTLPLMGRGPFSSGGAEEKTLLRSQREGRDGGGSSRPTNAAAVRPEPFDNAHDRRGNAAQSKDERPQAIDARAAYIVSDILADSAARALTFGLASPLSTRYRASVKTGTSKDMRDNWAVGYAGRYTVGVWVGNFSGAPMHDVSGVDGAAPIWREVMDFLQESAARPHADESSVPEAPPAGLVRQRVTYAGSLEPERDEWFIEGTERSRVVAVPARSVRPHIETPAHGGYGASGRSLILRRPVDGRR
jgi:penicillin-binding protein 1C